MGHIPAPSWTALYYGTGVDQTSSRNASGTLCDPSSTCCNLFGIAHGVPLVAKPVFLSSVLFLQLCSKESVFMKHSFVHRNADVWLQFANPGVEFTARPHRFSLAELQMHSGSWMQAPAPETSRLWFQMYLGSSPAVPFIHVCIQHLALVFLTWN